MNTANTFLIRHYFDIIIFFLKKKKTKKNNFRRVVMELFGCASSQQRCWSAGYPLTNCFLSDVSFRFDYWRRGRTQLHRIQFAGWFIWLAVNFPPFPAFQVIIPSLSQCKRRRNYSNCKQSHSFTSLISWYHLPAGPEFENLKKLQTFRARTDHQFPNRIDRMQLWCRVNYWL